MAESVKVFFNQSWLSFKALYGWLRLEVYVLAKVITPIFQVAFFAMVARFAFHAQDVSSYVIGNALHACYTSAFFGAAVMLRGERFNGTLAQVIGAPTSKFYVFAGRSLAYVLDGVLTVLIAMTTGMLLFGLDMTHSDWPLLVTAVLAGVASATAAGLFLGAFGLVITDINLLLNAVASSLLVFTGVNFPIDQLPAPLQLLPRVLPLTRALQAARLAYAGGDRAAIGGLLAGEVALALVYLIAGYVLFHYLERRARIAGSLDMY